ncbi:hypothetical protein OAF27_00905 [Verrucomicrobiales bacterium]|nr:hypothetical protein [Verrucomicrobiales bacterium]
MKAIFLVPLILPALLCASCKTIQNPELAAKVENIHLRRVSVSPVDSHAVRGEYVRSDKARILEEMLLVSAGALGAAAIGGPSAAQTYTNHALYGNPRDREGAKAAEEHVAATEIAIQSRMLKLVSQYQKPALARAFRSDPQFRGRETASSPWKFDCQILYAVHDRRKRHHYVYLEGQATITSASGELVWEGGVYGDSDTGYGGPAAPKASSLNELLEPGMLAAHVKAATAYIAQDLVVSLPGDFEWNEQE